MSIINNLLDYLYSEKNANIREAINKEMDEYQRILVKNGFIVKRSPRLVHYGFVQQLSAEKGNVILVANRKLRGRNNLSIELRHRKYGKAIPLFSYKLDEAIAVANIAQCIK